MGLLRYTLNTRAVIRAAALSTLSSLVTAPSPPTTLKERVQGAYFGALVADALCLGSHYEYDAPTIKKAYGGQSIDRYYGPGERMGGTTHGIGWGRRNYHPGQKKGDNTDYGLYNRLMLEYLEHARQDGKLNKRISLLHMIPFWRKRMESGQWGAWMCTQTKQTLQQVQKMGKLSKSHLPQLGGMSNAMAIRNTAAFSVYGEEDTLVDSSKKMMFTHKSSEAIVGGEFFTRVVYRIVHNDMTPRQAIETVVAEGGPLAGNSFVREQVKKGIAKFDEVSDPSRPLGKEEFVDDLAMTSMARLWNVGKTEPIKVGKASPTEGTMPSAIYMILKYEGDWEGAFKANAMVGGDSASRAIAIGMVLGAYHGAGGMRSHKSLGQEALNDWGMSQVMLDTLYEEFIERKGVEKEDEL